MYLVCTSTRRTSSSASMNIEAMFIPPSQVSQGAQVLFYSRTAATSKVVSSTTLSRPPVRLCTTRNRMIANIF